MITSARAFSGRLRILSILLVASLAATVRAAAPILNTSLDYDSTVGPPFQLTLTVTNSGLDATNVLAEAWDANGMILAGPTPSGTSWQTLYTGQMMTFAWTATPAGVGSMVYSATATEDSSMMSSPLKTVTVTVPPPAAVNLGTTINYAVLAKTMITDTGGHASDITGNIGLSPAAGSKIDVWCTEMTGQIYTVDATYVGNGNQACAAAGPGANKTLVDNAVLDMGIAYTDAAGRAPTWPTELYSGDISGKTLAPGVYKWSTNVLINTDVTLSGSATDVWIFEIAGDLNVAPAGSVATGIKVLLSGGADAKNIFWQVGGGTGATIGTYATFEGTILSAKQVILQTGAVLNGRALADSQVTLDENPVVSPNAAAMPKLRGRMDSTAATAPGQPVQLSLTVTNTGAAAASNVQATAWDSTGAILAGPTPSSAVSLAAGSMVTFAWTATPSAAGTIFYSATASEDSVLAFSPESTATVLVPSRIDARLNAARTTITVNQPVQLVLTVTNTGVAGDTNIKAKAWSSPVTSTGPAPDTLATLAAGAKAMFTWTVTPSASGVVVFTASATGDTEAPSLFSNASVTVQTPPAVTANLAATSATITGGSFMMTLTLGNTGQASASVSLTTTAFRVSGSGSVVTPYVGPSTAVPVLVASGSNVVLTWTVTAGTVGTGFNISNTVYVTDANGGPALPVIVVSTGNIAVVTLGGLVGNLSVIRTPAAIGQSAQFVLSVTNTGGTTVTNLTAVLRTDGPTSVGTSSPSSVATLAPGAMATFTWTVVPAETRALPFYATADGFTVSNTGTVPVASAQVTALLAGIPTPGANESFIYPSPARNAASIAYRMAESGTVKIRVYNAAGQLVAAVEDSKPTGVQCTAVSTSGLAPGVYFYMLERRYGSGKSDKIGPRKFAVAR